MSHALDSPKPGNTERPATVVDMRADMYAWLLFREGMEGWKRVEKSPREILYKRHIEPPRGRLFSFDDVNEIDTLLREDYEMLPQNYDIILDDSGILVQIDSLEREFLLNERMVGRFCRYSLPRYISSHPFRSQEPPKTDFKHLLHELVRTYVLNSDCWKKTEDGGLEVVITFPDSVLAGLPIQPGSYGRVTRLQSEINLTLQSLFGKDIKFRVKSKAGERSNTKEFHIVVDKPFIPLFEQSLTALQDYESRSSVVSPFRQIDRSKKGGLAR